jgi:hypothetical protein
VVARAVEWTAECVGVTERVGATARAVVFATAAVGFGARDDETVAGGRPAVAAVDRAAAARVAIAVPELVSSDHVVPKPTWPWPRASPAAVSPSK